MAEKYEHYARRNVYRKLLENIDTPCNAISLEQSSVGDQDFLMNYRRAVLYSV